MCVCISGQAESTPSVQNQYIRASYDMLEKTIIRSFAEKASVKRKDLQKLYTIRAIAASMGNPL